MKDGCTPSYTDNIPLLSPSGDDSLQLEKVEGGGGGGGGGVCQKGMPEVSPAGAPVAPNCILWARLTHQRFADAVLLCNCWQKAGTCRAYWAQTFSAFTCSAKGHVPMMQMMQIIVTCHTRISGLILPVKGTVQSPTCWLLDLCAMRTCPKRCSTCVIPGGDVTSRGGKIAAGGELNAEPLKPGDGGGGGGTCNKCNNVCSRLLVRRDIPIKEVAGSGAQISKSRYLPSAQ